MCLRENLPLTSQWDTGRIFISQFPVMSSHLRLLLRRNELLNSLRLYIN